MASFNSSRSSRLATRLVALVVGVASAAAAVIVVVGVSPNWLGQVVESLVPRGGGPGAM